MQCKYCKSQTTNPVYCSNVCQNKFERRARVFTGSAGPKPLKQYLIDERGHKCESCCLTSWQGNKIPLELDHINGQAIDNSISNLRLLCPNCHAQTPTFKAKNKGNGRKATAERLKMHRTVLGISEQDAKDIELQGFIIR